jgi:hypothetical protein
MYFDNCRRDEAKYQAVIERRDQYKEERKKQAASSEHSGQEDDIWKYV